MVRIAILTGGGRLPLALADSIVRRGGRAHLVAVRGEAGHEVEAYPHTWVTWGSINAILSALRRESDGTMMIAGSVTRPDLKNLKPDFGLIRHLPSVLSMLKGGDDAVLTRVVRFFEGHGLTVKGVGDVAPELLAEAGTLGATSDRTDIDGDMAIGFRVLDALADLDVGQAAVIESGRILGIEGVEGTDRMLARIAALPQRSAQGSVLVKGPKRGQELRVDVPTVGARTIDGLASARIATLVIAAGRTLLLDRELMLASAVENGVTIRSVDRTDDGAARPQPISLPSAISATVLGRITPSTSDSRDARTALEVILRLAAFDTGRASAVVRDHVLAVAAAEGTVAMAARIAELRQWGRRRARRGAMAILFDPARDDPQILLATIDAQAHAGLAGIAVMRDPASSADRFDIPSAVVSAADRMAMFIVAIDPAIMAMRARPVT